MSTSLRQQLASYWQRIQFLETEIERLTRELEEARRTIAVLASQVAASGSNPPATGKPKTRLESAVREALRPFALAASQRGEHEPDYSLRQPIKLGDLRRARAMLARLDAAEEPKP